MKYVSVILLMCFGYIFHLGMGHRKEQDIVESKNETENINQEVQKIIKKPNITKNATSNYSLYKWDEVDQKPKCIIKKQY